MEDKTKQLWDKTPGMCEEIPTITEYLPKDKKSDIAIIIFPGGGYGMRAEYEGKDYAEFLAENGHTAFVIDYRVAPHKFPLPLLDARRAIRTVRYNADKYGIDKNKIAVMGSSAGGHLAALVSTYFEPIEFENVDEIDKEDFIPNYQILCYPVISLFGKGITHFGSGQNLLGELLPEKCEELSPHLIVSKKTPPAFIWHTFADGSVSVKNSLMYAKSLKDYDIPTEMHIFPDGRHGLGLADGDDVVSIHVSQWKKLLLQWLKYAESTLE
jgi:acetyl esterase/lipase